MSNVSINEQLGNDKVDDLFRNYSIQQIQQVAKQYKKSIEENKNELHNLVGNKYRDLIKIAEDIDTIDKLSSVSDGKLKSLSYKSANFVNPYKDNYGKFDTLIRERKINQSKKNARSTIIRNVIQKKLNKLDDGIIVNVECPLLHTSNFIHYAKLYYTLENEFNDVLHNDNTLKTQFNKLKQSFNEFLEFEISSYNLIGPILNVTNDKFTKSQRIEAKDLILKDKSKVISNYELYEEEEDDDDIVIESVESEENQVVNEFDHSYDQNTSNICNYIVSYNILNGGINNLGERIINLRSNFIKSMLSQIEYSSIDFFKLFKYLECTCLYINKFFENKASNEYRITLSDATQPWSCYSLIGHKYWYDDKIVEFNYKERDTVNHDKALKDSFEWILKFLINLMERQGKSNCESLEVPISSFHNILVSLRNLEDFLESSGIASKFLSLVSSGNFFNDLLLSLRKTIKSSQSSHVAYLNDVDNGLIMLIKDGLKLNKSQKEPALFSTDILDLMDSNIEAYMEVLNRTGSSSSTMQQLKEWFDESNFYNRLCSSDQKGSDNKIIAYVDYLQHNLEIKWGTFSDRTIKDEFSKLINEMHEEFQVQNLKFVDSIKEICMEASQKDQIFYLIQILTQTKSNLKLEKNDEKIKVEIDEICQLLYEKLVHAVPDEEFFKSFKEAIDQNFEIQDDNTTPNRPNLKILSSLYQLAQTYYNLEDLESFSNPETSLFFIRSKNDWFIKVLIQQNLINYIDEKTKPKEDQDNEAKRLSSSQGLQLIANLIFILHFCQPSSTVSNMNDQIKYFEELCVY
ncbi:unnamed protein product [Candida verbasci]|uniref:Conserved oligomeric Golgi complex subunit 1 n=1 Tax=Candida verbasci TaxID=1227364 RepID=A0A9W4TSC6_9ASCO|nr:unnamed protein product [Candida verbasci]